GRGMGRGHRRAGLGSGPAADGAAATAGRSHQAVGPRRKSNVAGPDGRPQGAAERTRGGADCGRCAGAHRVGCRPGRSRGGARRDTPGGHGSLGVQEGHTVSSTLKSILFWMTLVVVLALIWQFSQSFQMSGSRISFSDFLTRVNQKEIQSVTFVGSNEVRGKYVALSSDGVPKSFVTYMPPSYDGLVNTLMGFGVEVSSERESAGAWTTILLSWAPILLIIGFWIFMMRQMQSGGNKALSFGKSRAKLSSSAQKKVTFRDVAGADEAKEELQEIIEFLREPQKFQKLGGRIPKGVLLMGSPGTGKTLLARAVAGEANVP